MTPDHRYHIVCHTCIFEHVTETAHGAAVHMRSHNHQNPDHDIESKRVK